MRILFFNYEYPPLGGGAGNASFYILKEFSNIADLEVDFVTSSIDDQYHEEKMGENITIHRLPIGKNEKSVHLQTRKDLINYTLKSYSFAKKLLKKNKYDLSHSFFTVPCGFVSLLLKAQYKIPYIVSLRGSDVPGYSERFNIIYKLITPLVRKIWNKADFVIANSEGLRDLAYKSKPNKTIEVIYNGIDTNYFTPSPQLRNENEIHIICGTRVTPRKGFRFLIQAMGEIVAKYPNVKLDIIGEGNEKESLINLTRALELGNFVDFVGMVAPENRKQIYARADIYASPSLNEGMCNFMLETMALGIPMVATNVGGTKELLTEGENGLIVNLRDCKDLAAKLEKLIVNKDLREKMGNANRKKAESLSWEKVSNQYIEVYKKVRNLTVMEANN